jgi:hypothetical protein
MNYFVLFHPRSASLVKGISAQLSFFCLAQPTVLPANSRHGGRRYKFCFFGAQRKFTLIKALMALGAG